ncbi:MAG: hypothetical protein EKK41_15410 [Hyphomicrobiales bacterium]|nr:MAG: hypothetical protein EKK41_15410 [Hyphomicrobiales bacterium]
MTSKPRFRQINTPDVSDADIERINNSMKVPTLVHPAAEAVMTARQQPVEAPRQHAGTLPPTQSARAGVPHKLTVRIPQSLNDTLKRDALDHRTYVRTIILCALQFAGYSVHAGDVLAPEAAARLRLAILSRRKCVEPSSMLLGAPSPQQKLSIDVPPSLEEALKRDALKRDTNGKRISVRTIILLALRVFGYPIADADLAPGAGGNC